MEFELLGELSAEDRRAVLAAAVRRRFGKGDVVFHEGDLGETLHLIGKARGAGEGAVVVHGGCCG